MFLNNVLQKKFLLQVSLFFVGVAYVRFLTFYDIQATMYNSSVLRILYDIPSFINDNDKYQFNHVAFVVEYLRA